MEKRKLNVLKYILLAVFILASSLITYYAMNLFWQDVANAAMGFNFPLTLATFPILVVGLEFIALVIGYVRYETYEPKYRKHLVNLYAIISIAFNGVGVLTSILAAVIAYKGNFLAACPFEGALIAYLVINVLLLATAVVVLVYNKKSITEEDEKVKTTHKYRIYTALIALFTFIAFDRCGAALAAPGYIEWSRFDLTWFFYLSLFLPLAVLVFMTLYRFNRLNKENTKAKLIIWGVLAGLSVALTLAVAITGIKEPLLVSLVSPAMPVERLATFPVDFLFLYGPVVVISLVKLIFAVIETCKKAK